MRNFFPQICYEGEGAGGTAPVVPVVPAPAAGSPYAALDAETVGYLQNRGLFEKPPLEALVSSIANHKQAEKFLGVPSTQLLRIPTDAKDEAGWKTVYSRLGAPADAAGYDFSTIKSAAGQPMSEGMVNTLRASALALHLPKEAATQLASDLQKHDDRVSAERAAVTADKLAKEKAELTQAWGKNADAFKLVAKEAAERLGVPAEAVSALESQIGYKAVMEMFQKIGSRMGEANFIRQEKGGEASALSKGEAQDRLNSLKADNAWVERYNKGGAAEFREMQQLLALIHGDDTEASMRIAGDRAR